MDAIGPIQGELQAQIMPTLWRLGAGTVEQVRAALPERYHGAYTTVQTVLNRLAQRGLLSRERKGSTIVYRPRISEAEYLSQSIDRTLSGASLEARQAVLAGLVGELDRSELLELQQLAKRAASARRRRG
jgi:predicted transcriptional regulator